jgi:hypothetical protein
VTLLLADLCALTWYLWAIPPDQVQQWEKTVSTVAGWVTSAMGFWGIKHVSRRKLSLAEMVSLRPVRLPMLVLAAGIWFFILPFHSIEVAVRGPDGNPLAGVMAKVDGDTRPNASDGEGRLSIGGLLACAHSIELEKTDYKPRGFRAHFADVLARGRLQPAPLERAEGTVTLLSDPPGAALYVDSETEKRGVAGTPIRLPVGTHIITLKLAGYQPWSEKVTVSAEKATVPGTRKLQAMPAPPARLYPLAVASDPVGAEVWVNKEFKGTTPTKIWLPAGEHKIELRKAGYESARGVVSIPARNIFTPWEPLKKLGGQ